METFFMVIILLYLLDLFFKLIFFYMTSKYIVEFIALIVLLILLGFSNKIEDNALKKSVRLLLKICILILTFFLLLVYSRTLLLFGLFLLGCWVYWQVDVYITIKFLKFIIKCILLTLITICMGYICAGVLVYLIKDFSQYLR